MFVSVDMGHGHAGIAVLRDRAGTFALDHLDRLDGPAWGMTLAHDDGTLFVTSARTVVALDIGQLEQAGGKPLLARFRDGKNAGAVYAILDPSEDFLFVSDEHQHRISVFNLQKTATGRFQQAKLVGRIPVGRAPVGLALSPDGHWLYATSEVAPRTANMPKSCETLHHRHAQGLLLRIDVATAESRPSRSLSGAVAAGCNPVRVAVSPSGDRLWVTARGDGQLLAIPSSAFSDANHASITRYQVGSGPVGVAVRPDGQQVWVALSHRFDDTRYDPKAHDLVGLDDVNGAGHRPAKLLSAPASGFPRELSFLPDGRTLVVTLYDAQRIEFVVTPEQP